MTEGLKQLNLIVNEELADGFGVELMIDNFEADFSELLVCVSLKTGGGETGTDFL